MGDPKNHSSPHLHHNHTLSPEQQRCVSTYSYMTPWATVLAMFAFYIIALLWFCKHGKKSCLPAPDSIFPYKRRLKYLKRVLQPYLVDDVFIELTDHKLGQGAVGFVFKGYVFSKSESRFKQRKFAAVKMSYPMPQKSIGLLEEAARMSRLNHENIVKIIAVSKLSFDAFRPMFAMEWLPGGSMAEFFKDEIRRKDEGQRQLVLVRHILHILIQVAEALKYLHESRDIEGNEFSHGDVAARNVLLTSRQLDSCVAKLGDFGLPIDFGPRLPIPWLPRKSCAPWIASPRSIDLKATFGCSVSCAGSARLSEPNHTFRGPSKKSRTPSPSPIGAWNDRNIAQTNS
ncbi:hypothetical protein L596_018110 [Steinernema carpocapsae]|nr:hypothetical protein L596_018110 [Steinernema carpocapsae]